MPYLEPLTEEAILDVERLAADRAGGDPLLLNNWRYWFLYSYEEGQFRRMNRRQWIEEYVRIRNKKGEIVPFILRACQRRCLATILRMERAGLPIRVITLKARQQGFSTLFEALIYERLQRLRNRRALIIAHRKDTSKLLLDMTDRMRRNLMRSRNVPWEFKFSGRSRYHLRWDTPFDSEIEVTSAEVLEPGHGDTCQYVHMSETARWPNAEDKVKGVLQILPLLPGTMGFNESTANGDTGYFRKVFWKAWNERDLPLWSERRVSAWRSMFFPWYEHEEYRWTQTLGEEKEISKEMLQHLTDTIDDDEIELLKQRYLRRGVGWVHVDYDQLLWRRHKIASDLANLADFHEQYPAYPHEAFQASGRPAFDATALRRLLQEAEDPDAREPWRGEIVEVMRVAG